MKRAVFMDRDGVINEPILRENKVLSPRQPNELRLVATAGECLARLRAAGFLNIVVTNQPDISRGLMGLDVLEAMHERVRSLLPVDEIMVCPHDDKDRCTCRKPQPGMLLMAAEKWDIALSSSFMVGDQWKDVEAGRGVGCCTVLIDYPYNVDVCPDHRVKSLSEAVDLILRNGVMA